jgi:putative membrane protein
VKSAARITLIFGVGVMIVLIAHEGALGILRLLSQAGWTLLWLLPLHALPLLLDATGWRAIILAQTHLRTLFCIAVVRQAVNGLLPVANVGGEIVGIRLLIRSGVDGIRAAASVIVEVSLTLIGQYLFVALGVGFLLQVTRTSGLTSELLFALAASAPLLVVLIALLRHGALFQRLARIVKRLAPNIQGLGFLDRGLEVDAAINHLLGARVRLATALGWQLAGLLAEAVETWAALWCLGVFVGFPQAVILESLTQAARQFMFIVPAGLGVQEVGFVAVGHVLGLSGEIGVALSLAKRMIRIVFGIPALLAWQYAETRRAATWASGPTKR